MTGGEGGLRDLTGKVKDKLKTSATDGLRKLTGGIAGMVVPVPPAK